MPTVLNSQLNVCIVGTGFGSRLHSQIYSKAGVNIAYICGSEKSKAKALQEGKVVFDNYEQANKNVQIIDICVPTGKHLKVIQEIAFNPQAKIIVEKPICTYDELSSLAELQKKYPGLKVCVQENHRASITTYRLAEMVKEKFKSIESIVIERTKNRKEQFKPKDGEKESTIRYVAPMGVWEYEGTHIQTIFDKFCDYMEISTEGIDYTSSFSALGMENVDESKHKQGGSQVVFTTKNKINVIFYTSMTGNIGYPFPPYAKKDSQIIEPERRYRIFAVKGKDAEGSKGTLVAFYDKVDDLKPLESVIYFIDDKGQHIRVTEPFEDDTMKKNLEQCAEYLLDQTGKIHNPSPIEASIKIVENIHHFNESETKSKL